jgi:hypothetical protein
MKESALMKTFVLKSWLMIALLVTCHTVTAAPATHIQLVTNDSDVITMRLTLQDLRGLNFELWSQNGSGAYDVETPVAERSYLGTVDEYPGAISYGIFQDDGSFRGGVVFDRGGTWWTLDGVVTRTRGTGPQAGFGGASYTVDPGHGGTNMYGFDVGVDARYEYYSDRGSNSVAKTFEHIEYSVTAARALYMNNALLRPYIARVIVRTSSTHCPYYGISGSFLNELKTEWTNNHAGASRDLVAGITSSTIGGGYAWVGVVGEESGFSVNDSDSDGDFAVTWRHEMGHNWGLSHYDGGAPEGTTINSGNSYARMSGPEAEKVLDERDAKLAYLDNEGVYTAVNLPPYAALDVAIMTQVVNTAVSIDVLANDHDANGQMLSLLSFDTASYQGGSITQSGGYLVYSPPSGAFIGSDYFTYTVGDTSNQQATGVATITVEPDDSLRLYLPLDETTGTTVSDYSPFKLTGTVNGTDLDTDSVAGQFINAVQLDGADKHISVPNVNVNADTVTLAAWIKPAASQDNYAGVIFDRSSGGAGLNIMTNRALRYHWPSSTYYSWDSGLIVPADTWTFVALVVQPSSATIYMNTGTGFQSATNGGSHVAAVFGTTGVGQDLGWGASRAFSGAMDDVRIYNRALTEIELLLLYDGGMAEGPRPVDGATGVTTRTLSWASAANALTNLVYLGTNLAAVSSATPASSELQASITESFYKASLADATTYYWRIDSVKASGTVTGTVWTFQTGSILYGDTVLINFQRNSGEAFNGNGFIGPTLDDSGSWNALIGPSGTASNLVDNIGDDSPVSISWLGANMWSNGDGTSDDEHRLSAGYLDDGNSGSGKGVTISLTNIPYTAYRVYGLFASDQNSGAACGIVNVNVNGSWALGGNASTTASAWGYINSNYADHGVYWSRIVPGTVQGNYWIVDTSGSACSIVSEVRNGQNRGSLTGLIIEQLPDADGDGISDENDPDDDNDGMSDEWELAHGLNALTNDAVMHSDSDNLNNFYEYITDTDPQDGNAYQTFFIELPGGGSNAVLRFGTSSNRLYNIEHKSILDTNAWNVLGADFSGSGSEMTIQDSLSTSNRYYRLRISVP